ncbi:hypothetical protein [Streptomyces dysideae]|uniref:Uncharacterized protein n=1 Tax=Streptomyces dysideae TaxID=909626 RepID=A0A101UST2_9ACTN|nr:hypothetical protein [Streptomyces dysideae]KUO16224.1 hypothetical protein AQJ91_36990 [Streptomyces dysideae]
MRPLRPTGSASPASGVLRGMRAGVLAVLCVLLPLAGHALTQSHAPRWIIIATVAAVAVPGAAVLTRHRLTDAQVVAVLTAAQVASHVAYALPGACRAVTGEETAPPGLYAVVEHGADAGPPAGVLLAGHLVTVIIAARLLGVGEQLLWRSGPLLAAVRRLLLFLWPLLGRVHGTGPEVSVHVTTAPLRSAVLTRLREGRAPPRRARASLAPLRPMPVGGPLLP